MDPATALLIGQLLETFLSASITQLPSVIMSIQTAIGLLKSNTDPTDDQLAQIRATLDASETAVQAA